MKTILVVEDDTELRETVRDFLEEEGYGVKVAPNGAVALEMLRSYRPCLILLDLQMPELDGWQFHEALKSDPKLSDLHVLLSTSHSDRAPVGVPLLKKPLHLDQLSDYVKNHCG